MVRRAGVFADTHTSWNGSENLTDHLSGLMFRVLCACGHLIAIKEERGTVSGEAGSEGRVPRLSAAFVILCAA